MNQKNLFKKIFIFSAILLSILPAVVTFSAILTTLLEKVEWYVWLQNFVVPIESRFVAVLVRIVGIEAYVTSNRNFPIALLTKNESYLPVALEWNCLGWQSMVLLLITFVGGLRGHYTFVSRVVTILMGIFGTFLTNLLRMAFVVTLAYYWSAFAALIVHDYFASFIALIWMIFFWWFSYSYLLEEKE